jgi:hypothetical protein
MSTKFESNYPINLLLSYRNLLVCLLHFIRITPEGVDIVLDCLCGEDCNRGYGLLKPMGKYILFGSSNVVTGETKSFFSVARSVSAKDHKFLRKTFTTSSSHSSGGKSTKSHRSSFSMRTRHSLDSTCVICSINKAELIIAERSSTTSSR